MLPEPGGGEDEARTAQTLPIEANLLEGISRPKWLVLSSQKKKNQTFLTPISCSKRIKVNFVQRQVASKRARPAEGLPPGLGNFPHPFSLQPFTVILMQQSPRMGVRLRLRESSAGGPRSPA